MIICRTNAELHTALSHRREKNSHKTAFVPTMGNLHAGHIQLIREAHNLGDTVVCSIFVNPMQFGPNEDLASYPRTLDADCDKLKAAGCHLVFIPSVGEIYPNGVENQTQVTVPELGEVLCGASRPGHFNGVTTVVNKLLNIVQPEIALFGQKDFQQLAIIRKMVQDLCIPVKIIGVPTVRSDQGLALSSRNGYLTQEEISLAPKLYQSLISIRQQIEIGETDFEKLCRDATSSLTTAGFKVDYLSVRRQSDLKLATANSINLVIVVAAHLGRARLIDNISFALNPK